MRERHKQKTGKGNAISKVWAWERGESLEGVTQGFDVAEEREGRRGRAGVDLLLLLGCGLVLLIHGE